MLPPTFGDECRIDHAGLGELALIEKIFRPLAQRPAQPLIDGYSEAHLRTIDQRLRHVAVKHLAQ